MCENSEYILCVIPARSGSRRFKDKNIQPFCGTPLLGNAVRVAKRCKLLSEVIVSTDSERYAEIATSYGAKVPFLRPSDLAEDVPTEEVIIHAVKWVEENWGVEVGVAVTVQCTSPFITTTDIDNCVRALLEDPEADSAMTVTEVREHPAWTFTVNGKYLKPFLSIETKGEWGVSQCLPKVYVPNGMCYATRRETLLFDRKIIGEKCIPVFVSGKRSIEIDEEFDLKLSERIAELLEWDPWNF